VPPGPLPEPGTPMHFELTQQRLHFFEPVSGKRIV
jgi:hypothetical protein